MSPGLNIMVSVPLFTVTNIAVLCMNLNFNNMVLCVLPCNISRPDISSLNGVFTLINFCSLGFSATYSFGKMGRDLFKNLK